MIKRSFTGAISSDNFISNLCETSNKIEAGKRIDFFLTILSSSNQSIQTTPFSAELTNRFQASPFSSGLSFSRVFWECYCRVQHNIYKNVVLCIRSGSDFSIKNGIKELDQVLHVDETCEKRNRLLSSLSALNDGEDTDPLVMANILLRLCLILAGKTSITHLFINSPQHGTIESLHHGYDQPLIMVNGH